MSMNKVIDGLFIGGVMGEYNFMMLEESRAMIFMCHPSLTCTPLPQTTCIIVLLYRSNEREFL